MANYSYEAGASFPANGVMPLTNFLDATNEIATAINQIKTYQASGDYEALNNYLALHPTLKRYIINAEVINRIDEETRNVEIYASDRKQQVFYQSDQPATTTIGDVWIG